jgi:protein phosphatase 2C-like protein
MPGPSATWPEHGEYASTTFFITDDPEPTCRVLFRDESVDELALFSDGVEHLVLDFAAHTAFAPFFNKMFAPLHGSCTGRDRMLSRSLRRFLDGPSVCEKTDDDKTLILAKRVMRQ